MNAMKDQEQQTSQLQFSPTKSSVEQSIQTKRMMTWQEDIGSTTSSICYFVILLESKSFLLCHVCKINKKQLALKSI